MTAPRPPFSEVPVDDGSGGVPTGDDTAGDWIGWDERNIPIADDLYDRYLDEPPEELECRDQHGPREVPGRWRQPATRPPGRSRSASRSSRAEVRASGVTDSSRTALGLRGVRIGAQATWGVPAG